MKSQSDDKREQKGRGEKEKGGKNERRKEHKVRITLARQTNNHRKRNVTLGPRWRWRDSKLGLTVSTLSAKRGPAGL